MVSYLLQSFDVATGNCVVTRAFSMPQVAPEVKDPPWCTDIDFFISGRYVWFTRQAVRQGLYRGIGFGVYSFYRDNLSQKCFLPCFEEEEVSIHMPRMYGKSHNNWILARCFGSVDRVFQKISIDDEGNLMKESQPTRYWYVQ